MPNPENFRERGTQVFGAHRQMARGNLIDPSPSANLAGVDEENLRNWTGVFPLQFRFRRFKACLLSVTHFTPRSPVLPKTSQLSETAFRTKP